MEAEYQYLRFVLIERKPKTAVYSCQNKHHGDQLGVIKWYPAWRQYCYFPTVQAVYSDGCLKDIASFIGQLKDGRDGTH